MAATTTRSSSCCRSPESDPTWNGNLHSMTTGTLSLGRAASRAAALGDLRAIAFDLDNTLWDVGPVIVRAEQCLHDWLRQHCPRIAARVSIDEMRAARELLSRNE